MHVDIVGAGVSGSWLARLLKDHFQIEVFDPSKRRGCKCGWGSTRSLLDKELKKVGLHLKDYELCRPNFSYVNHIGYPVTDAVMFNKNKLLEDLTEDIDIIKKKVDPMACPGDVVVNATASPLAGSKVDVTNYCIQRKMRLKGAESETSYIWFDPESLGYGWVLPLDEGAQMWHVGAGSIKGYEEATYLTHKTLAEYNMTVQKIVCGCHRPFYMGRNFVVLQDHICSVGEAAGAVFPLTGEGVLPAISTAQYLAESLFKHDHYLTYLTKLHELLEGYEEAFKALECLRKHRHWGMVRIIRAMAERMKQRTRPIVTWKTKIHLLWKLL